jgi:hypothetical protein
MINISQDFGGIPVVWVRFNPDSYVDSKGNKHRSSLNDRIEILITTLKKCEEYKCVDLCSIVYLYYDQFDKYNICIDSVNLNSLGL